MSTKSKPFKNARTPCECAFCWKMKKTWRAPDRLPTIHLIEALADSANQMLVRNNLEGVSDRLNRILTVTREIIREMPEEVPRCMFIPKGTRAKCGYPLINGNCNIHGTRFRDVRIFFSTEKQESEDWNLGGQFSLD